MKIAVCLYGKQREFEKCRPSWITFGDTYTPDIFYHSWDGILWGINTKAIMISPDMEFAHLHPGIDQYSSSAKNVLHNTSSTLARTLASCASARNAEPSSRIATALTCNATAARRCKHEPQATHPATGSQERSELGACSNSSHLAA